LPPYPKSLDQARDAADAIRKNAGPRRSPSHHAIVAAAPKASPGMSRAIVSTPATASVAGAKSKPKEFSAADPLNVVAEGFLTAREDQYSSDQLVRYRSMLKLHMTPLHGRPMREIESQEIADALKPIWNGSADSTGRKLRPLIELLFEAVRIAPNPATIPQLTKLLVRGLPEKPTEPTKSVASLPYAEVPALMTDLAKDSGDVARLIRFVVLTGVRIKEALGATWGEIDLNATIDKKPGQKVWRIPAARMKMDVEHVVALSAEAIAVLGPRTNDGKSLIFKGARFGREIGQNVALRYLKEFHRVDAKGASVTIHGFRSSMATWAEERNPPFTPKVIHFNLAHYNKEDKTTKAYLRGEHWKKRVEMMEAWGAFATSV
jgi:integrase